MTMKDPTAELVRVDGTGLAHPIGMVASQRMRAREGAYRVMPAPKHVVFMRYTGEDGRRDAEDGSIVRLAGEITAPAGVSDVLSLVGQAGWRGELVVMDGEATRAIFVDQGHVVGAETSAKSEYLGEVMYKFGALDREAHERVVAGLGKGKRYGELAVDLGVASQDKVYEYLAKQVLEIVLGMLKVSDGTFYFLEGFDERRLATHLAVSSASLLMDAITRLDELHYFAQRIPTNHHVPVRFEGRAPPEEDLAWALDAVDGKLDIEELGRATGRGQFQVTKALYALVQSKHVAIRPPHLSGGPSALVSAANDALRAIMGAADAAGRGTAVRDNLASFASGAGLYEILFRGAGPDGAGALAPKTVADNADRLAKGDDAQNTLRQLLHDYVSFALFTAGAAIGAERESTLAREVGAALTRLLPQSTR